MPLATVVSLCANVGYAIPREQLDELKKIDESRGAKTIGKHVALTEPDIPAGYRRGASIDDPAVADQSADGGILAEACAHGVLVEGSSDAERGSVGASLLLALQRSLRTNDLVFIDWADFVDDCRASPLYGPESSSAAIKPLKKASVVVLHGIDYCVENKDGADNLGKVLRARVAGEKTTIMTSATRLPVLLDTVGRDNDLYEYIRKAVAKPDHKPNVIWLR